MQLLLQLPGCALGHVDLVDQFGFSRGAGGPVSSKAGRSGPWRSANQPWPGTAWSRRARSLGTCGGRSTSPRGRCPRKLQVFEEGSCRSPDADRPDAEFGEHSRRRPHLVRGRSASMTPPCAASPPPPSGAAPAGHRGSARHLVARRVRGRVAAAVSAWRRAGAPGDDTMDAGGRVYHNQPAHTGTGAIVISGTALAGCAPAALVFVVLGAVCVRYGFRRGTRRSGAEVRLYPALSMASLLPGGGISGGHWSGLPRAHNALRHGARPARCGAVRP